MNESQVVDPLPDADEPVREPSSQELQPALEALLLMAEEPVPALTLAEVLAVPVARVIAELNELAEFYDQTGRGFQLCNVGGGWRYSTRAEQHDLIVDWVKQGAQNRLTQASLETLAVIAYLQPTSRGRVSAVRGVNVDSAVRTLKSRGLIEESGTDEQTGAGLLTTTDYFLERIGLASLDDLPQIAPRLPDASDLEAELAGLATSRLGQDDGNHDE